MEAESLEKKKSNKIVFIVILFIIIMLGVIISLVYFNNSTFKVKVDELIEKLPWVESKTNKPSLTEEETKGRIVELAEYFLSLDEQSAADKLYIVKIDDEILYSEIIKAMNKKSSSKTGNIIKLVRDLGNRDDILVSIHNDINEDKDNRLIKEAKRFENQELLLTIREIKSRLESDEEFKKNLPDILNNMSESAIANILYYTKEETKDQIFNMIPTDKRAGIENKVISSGNQYTALIDLATFYETKPLETAINEIGNTDTYSYKDLGVIYSHLSILRSAEILSRIEDDVFIQELFAAIRREEQLSGIEPVANKISEAIEFIAEYNNKIDDLVTVYEDMEPSKVARIVEEMINNNTTVTALEIESQPIFEISDSSIIIDVVSRMRTKLISNILNYMSIENASKLTQVLARP